MVANLWVPAPPSVYLLDLTRVVCNHYDHQSMMCKPLPRGKSGHTSCRSFNAHVSKPARCPRYVFSNVASCTSHRHAVQSEEALTTYAASTLNTQSHTHRVWPFSSLTSSKFYVSHTLIVVSADAVASQFPSSDKVHRSIAA